VLVPNTGGGVLGPSAGDATLQQLCQTLRLKVTDPAAPDDRHAISNLLGPMILLGRAPLVLPSQEKADGSKEADHLQALRTVLEVCELIPSKGEAVAKDLVGKAEPPQRSPVLANTRVVLLDDQWNHGWGEWVCQTLGVQFHSLPCLSPLPQRVSAAGDVEVFVASDPNWLLQRLALAETQKDKRLRLSLTDPPEGVNELLLLDLRLFSGKEDKERLFIKELLPLCKRFTNEPCAWKPFDIEDLERLEHWCEVPAPSSKNSAGILSIARSLLGRLVALIDFSLPIVLFSSTGDRDLVSLLAPYGNIITSFSKPRTFGVSQSFQSEEIEGKLQGALISAERMSRARAFLRVLSTTACELREKAKTFLKVNGKTESKWTHAELYIDESGPHDQPVDHVGGCAVLYENAEFSPNEVYKALKSVNLIWGASREETPIEFKERVNRRGATQIKASSIKDNFCLDRRMKSTVQTLAGVSPFAACVLAIPDSFKSVSLPGGPDLRYREVASTLIELFLYDWLPVIGQCTQTNLTAGVFVATRMWSPQRLQTLIDCQWAYGSELHSFKNSLDRKNPGKPNADMVPIYDVPHAEQGKVGFPPPPNKERNCLVPVDSRGSRSPDEKRYVKAKTMSSSDPYEMVVGIAIRRPAGAAVIRANGVTLRDGCERDKDDGPFLPRQIHYSSDDLLAVIRRQPLFNDWRHSPLFDSGFYATAIGELQLLTHASRALDVQGSFPEAINLLWTIWEVVQVKDAARWVAARAASHLEAMNGRQFLEVCHLRALRANTVSATIP